MKKFLTLLLALSFLLVCGCNNGTAVSSDSSSDSATDQTKSTTETSTAEERVWTPNFSEYWNFEPAIPSIDNFDRHSPATDLSTYDIDFHLDIEEFSVSDIPDDVYVTIENRNGTPFIMAVIPMLYLEKLYTLPKEEEEGVTNLRLERYFYDVWVRVPMSRDEYYEIMWGELARHEMNHTFDMTKLDNSLFAFTPGEYRFVIYTLAGPYYAYFTVTE